MFIVSARHHKVRCVWLLHPCPSSRASTAMMCSAQHVADQCLTSMLGPAGLEAAMHKYWTSAADSALHQGQQHDPRADEDTFIDSTHLPSYSAAAWQSELGV